MKTICVPGAPACPAIFVPADCAFHVQAAFVFLRECAAMWAVAYEGPALVAHPTTKLCVVVGLCATALTTLVTLSTFFAN